MQEHHPIDELFRQALHGSGKLPPPHVRGAVLSAVRSRHRRALWRKRSKVALLVLLLGVLGTWSILNTINQEAMMASDDAQRSEAPLSTEVRLSPEASAESVHPKAIAPTKAGKLEKVIQAASQARSEPSDEANHTASGLGHIPDGASRSVRDGVDLATGPTGNDGVAQIVPEGWQSLAFTNRFETPPSTIGDATRIASLHSAPSTGPVSGAPILALARSLPSLSHGDSWLAIHATAYGTKNHWSGTATRLVDAMNESERSRTSVSLGLMAGRQWRSGFGIGAGAEVERSEQVFRHEETLVHEEESVVANMVTLNTIVYSMSYDTLTTRYVEPISAEGMDVRTTVRVPLEAYWQGTVRRWLIGARAGLAGEFTHVRSGASLVQDANDGAIRSRSLEAGELASRYPARILGTAGVDIGFVIGERTTLLATPQYQHALGDGPRNSICATPERIGVRLQLLHTL